MANIGDLFIDLTATPQGYNLFVVTEVEDRPRFGKPNQLLTGKLYCFTHNSKENAVFEENTLRWLSSLNSHLGSVKDINVDTLTIDNILKK